MAYKFQLGAFTASGSIKAEEGFDANNADINNVDSGSFGEVSASGMILAAEVNFDDASGIAGDGLTDSFGALTINLQTNPGLAVAAAGLVVSLSGSTLTKDANGISVQISGSGGLEETPNGLAVQLENGGGLVAGETGIELTMVDAGATVAVADDTFYFADSDNGDNIRSGSFVDLATGMAGNGISATNGVLAADLNGSSLLNGASGLSVNVVSLAGAGLVENSGVFDVGAGNGITVAADAVTINLSGSDSGLNLNADGLSVALSSSGGLGNDANGVFIALDDPNSGLTIGASGIKIETGGVTNDMLSGSIDNAKLSNNDITVGTTAIALGASSTTLAGMTGIDFAAGNASIAANIGANTLTLGGATSTVQIAGDLDVVGTLNRVTETELLIEDKAVIVASGSLNAAAAAGAGLKVDIQTGDMTFLYQANGENVGGVDASASGDIFVASGSAGLIDIQAANFYGNGSNLSGISADSVSRSVTTATADANIAGAGVFIGNIASGGMTFTITLTPAQGDEILVKAGSAVASDNTVTITDADDNIDGQASIILESPYAAVTLIYDGTEWKVF